ncbi:MAG: prephenate dehydratase [Chloroflexota bacterium]|nr:prephenate dehydratase [Chloroflexota bacterium]
MPRSNRTRPAIAFQGEPGAYGQEAIIGYFGEGNVEPIAVPTFSAVCASVEGGETAGGVLPLENSAAGSVGDALDALVHGRLRVIGEVLLPVRHQLLAAWGVELSAIRRVSSHWQALAQCDRYLAATGWEEIPAADTAGAARDLAASRDPHLAVIASQRAADRYRLRILASDIQDDPGNQTRFAVLARRRAAVPRPAGPFAPSPHAARSTIITFQTAHMAGALHRALGALAEGGVNLSRIESRPAGGTRWQYRFLVQVDGDQRAEPLRSALARLRRQTRSVRVLGSFPAAG